MGHANHLYAIAIGSNRRHGRHGRPTGVVAAAIARLDADFGLFDAAPIIVNPAVGGAGREFANSLALVESALHPLAILDRLKVIEGQFGRRAGRRWGPRVLDLDLVAWSGGSFHSPRLTIPHSRLAERGFVLAPFAAIAPGWRVDSRGSVRQMLHRLGKRAPRG